MDLQDIARVLHELNRAVCEFNNDFSQLPYDQAPDWQKKSIMDGIIYHMENPDAGDSDSHDNWMKEKVNEGWVYGDVKDPEAKTHPCMVPYEMLPIMQRIKDRIFRTAVHQLLPLMDDEMDIAIENENELETLRGIRNIALQAAIETSDIDGSAPNVIIDAAKEYEKYLSGD